MSQWKKIREIFRDALKLEEENRYLFVVEQSGGDEYIIAELMDLLGVYSPDFKIPLLEDSFINEPPKINKVVNGFTIVSYIGSGGFGHVYKAQGELFRDQVAVKFLKLRHNGDDALRRFIAEMNTLAECQHEGLARIRNGGELNGQLYIIMDFIEGKNLGDYCKGQSLDQILEVFQKVCQAIGHIHDTKYIHRDIKPSNIMVTERGEVKVLDLGIAVPCTGDQGVVPSERAGTPPYMSPEQLQDKKLSFSADVYALGVLLYQILTEQWPYEGMDKVGNNLEAVKNVVTSQDRIPLEARLRLPRIMKSLGAIVRICLERSAENRYANANLLSKDIGRLLNRRPIVSRRNEVLHQGHLWCRRNRILAIMMILALLFSFWGGVTLRKLQVENKDERLFSEFSSRWDREIKDCEGDMVSLKNTFRDELEKHQAVIDNRHIAKGSGYFTLGYIHMLLGDYQRALYFLEKAQSANYSSPRFKYALARCKLEDFWRTVEALNLTSRDSLSAVGLIDDKPLQEVTNLLKGGEKDWHWLPREYILALQEYCGLIQENGHLDESALEPVFSHLDRLENSYIEKHILVGRIHAMRLRYLVVRGETRKIMASFQLALAAFGKADEKVCGNLPSIKVHQADLYRLVVNQTGDRAEAYFKAGAELGEKALQMDPCEMDASLALAELNLHMGLYEKDLGRKRDYMKRAVEHADIRSDNWHHLRRAGSVFLESAKESREAKLYLKARQSLERARKMGEQAGHSPDPELFRNLGKVNQGMAKQSGNPRILHESARRIFEEGLEKFPNHAGLHLSMGYLLKDIAGSEVKDGSKKANSFDGAIHHFKRATALSERWLGPYALASVLRQKAELCNSPARAEELLLETMRNLDETLQRDPHAKKPLADILASKAGTLVNSGILAWEQGQPFVPQFQDAERLLKAAEKESGNLTYLLLRRTMLYNSLASLLAMSGEENANALKKAHFDYTKISRNDRYYLFLVLAKLKTLLLAAENKMDLNNDNHFQEFKPLLRELYGTSYESKERQYRGLYYSMLARWQTRHKSNKQAEAQFEKANTIFMVEVQKDDRDEKFELEVARHVYYQVAWLQKRRIGEQRKKTYDDLIQKSIALLDDDRKDRYRSQTMLCRGKLKWLQYKSDNTLRKEELKQEALRCFEEAGKNTHLNTTYENI